MTAPLNSLSSFITELRRRRVFRVAAVYAGIAFVVIQIIDGTFAVMGIPDWISRFMIILLLIGFPIAIGLAWAFDITDEGIVRTKGRPANAPRKAVLIVSNPFLITITVIAVIVAGWSWFGGEAESQEIYSIAVLPLENMSSEPDQEYFVAGMHEALTAELSKISALRVVGRTSTMSYKGTTKSIPEIATELGVDALIEGSVVLADGEVRVTAQLIAANPERHLWAGDYVRSMSEVLALHKEVAQAIAHEIKVTLTPDEVANLATQPTVNPEAYQAFLRGRYFEKKPHFTLDNWNMVVKNFQQAVDLDPNFALAWAELAVGHSRIRYTKADLSRERLEMATQAADRALELDPDSPEIHRILSYYYMWAYLDADRAFEALEIAKAGLSDDAEYFKALGFFNFYLLGEMEEAERAFEKAFELSPRDASIPTELLWLTDWTRDFPRAISFANQAIEILPDEFWPYVGKWAVYFWDGNLEKSREALEASPSITPEWYTLVWYFQETSEGQFQKALDRILSFPHEMVLNKMWGYPKSYLAVPCYMALNKPELANQALLDAKTLLESEVKKWPQDPRLHSTLGTIYGIMGLKEEAIREGRRAVEILPVSKDAYYGVFPLETLAQIYASVGEHDLALDVIEQLLSIPSIMTVKLLKHDSNYKSLRELPRFQQLVEKYGVTDE